MSALYEKVNMEGHDQFLADVAYFNAQWNEIREAHPDCHVAVYKGEVAASAPDIRKLVKALKKQGGAAELRSSPVHR